MSVTSNGGSAKAAGELCFSRSIGIGAYAKERGFTAAFQRQFVARQSAFKYIIIRHTYTYIILCCTVAKTVFDVQKFPVFLRSLSLNIYNIYVGRYYCSCCNVYLPRRFSSSCPSLPPLRTTTARVLVNQVYISKQLVYNYL